MVLESTTYPGTTRERLLPILEESGLAVGRDFNLAFSPERIDPGRTDHTIHNTPKIVGGMTDECRERAAELYRLICDEVVEVSSPGDRRASKLLENIFRSVNIALVNELAQLCDRIGIDVWEVVDAAATKPFGFMRFDPGPGHGRPLPAGGSRSTSPTRRASTTSTPSSSSSPGSSTRPSPQFCVERIEHALNDVGKPVAGRASWSSASPTRPGSATLRESPALKIIRCLRDLGADVSYHDPHVAELPELALASVEPGRGARRRRHRVHRHGPPGGRPREGRRGRPPLVLDFRGVTRGIEAAEPGPALAVRRCRLGSPAAGAPPGAIASPWRWRRGARDRGDA